MFPRGLLGQLFGAYLALTVLLMLLAGGYAAYTARRLHLEQVAAELQGAARVGAARLARAAPAERTAEARAIVAELAAAFGGRMTVALPSGEVTADSHEDPRHMDNHRDRPEVAEALAGGIGRSTRYSNTLREDLMYLAVPAQHDGEVVGAVRAAKPLADLSRTLHAVYGRLALVGALMTVLVAGVSFGAARRILRPMQALRAGAERFARGELQHRLDVAGPPEMARLACSLNEMASQLDARIRTILTQENEHEAMLASMEEGVLAVDDSYRIVSLNDACARLLGLDGPRLRGCLLQAAVRRPDLLEFVEEALTRDEAVDGELKFLGQPDRWLHAHGTALRDAEGNRTGALIVFYDVTRIRQLENVRRDFVANVSHELKTPITSIKGFVETLLDDGLADKETSLEFLQIILRQVNRMDAIIADLLSLASLERGQETRTIALEPTPLHKVLRAACEICRRAAAEKEIRLEIDCPDELVANVNAPLLEQAVVNLVDNAVKYSERGAVVYVDAAADGPGARIAVRDRGCGIAPQHLARLFERFYRVDRARSRELGGTGLGLAIVKHIMTAHRGSATVESTVGRGSTFVLYLAPPLPAPAPPPEGQI